MDYLISDHDALNLGEESNYSPKGNDKYKSKRNRKTLTFGLFGLIVIISVAIGYMLIKKSQVKVKAIESLAALPLKNLSGDPDQEIFSDGMTEALITELSRIKALKVISRTSVMRYISALNRSCVLGS
jgi:hypothetical protein